MRKAKVIFKNECAGILTQQDDGSFAFQYDAQWVKSAKPAVSLTLPVTDKPYLAPHLFPFFYNLLPEGTNKQTVCFQLRIDTNDHFSILMATAKYDTIGAVRIEKIETVE
ncbi:MAG TPA: HipA N-terminal domain-containing protein [Cytophagaceae bacterium]|jgi:HipA-like protein|nr:HipA N-terminal domain-containing protein [Cytophagaceae bacterium]